MPMGLQGHRWPLDTIVNPIFSPSVRRSQTAAPPQPQTLLSAVCQGPFRVCPGSQRRRCPPPSLGKRPPSPRSFRGHVAGKEVLPAPHHAVLLISWWHWGHQALPQAGGNSPRGEPHAARTALPPRRPSSLGAGPHLPPKAPPTPPPSCDAAKQRLSRYLKGSWLLTDKACLECSRV